MDSNSFIKSIDDFSVYTPDENAIKQALWGTPEVSEHDIHQAVVQHEFEKEIIYKWLIPYQD